MSASGDIGKVDWKADDCKCSVQGETMPLEFSLEVHEPLSKCAVSPQVVLSMSPDMPICLTFVIEHGYMKFYLAPKVVE